MTKHYYDNCDDGICLRCDYCRDPKCCPQSEECDGHNWDFLKWTNEDWIKKFRETNSPPDGELRDRL
jgi:hypothetical protein